MDEGEFYMSKNKITDMTEYRVLKALEDPPPWLFEAPLADEYGTVIRSNGEAKSSAGVESDGVWRSVDGIERKVFDKVYLVEGMLEEKRIYQVFGKWKQGKTLVVLDLCCHLSLGMEWAGHRTCQSLVLYVASEAPDDIERRVAAWKVRHSIFGGMPFKIRCKPVYLNVEAFAAELAGEVEGWKAQYEGMPVIVVIDTVARSMAPGADENSMQGLGALVANLIDVVARPTDATAIVVNHSGQADDSRARGWSGMPAAIDGEFKVSKTDGVVKMSSTFQRNGSGGDALEWEVRTVQLAGIDNFGNRIIEPVLQYRPAGVEVRKEKALSFMAVVAFNAFETLVGEQKKILDEGGILGVPRVLRRDLKSALEVNKKFPKGKIGKTFDNNFSSACVELVNFGKFRIEHPFIYYGDNAHL